MYSQSPLPLKITISTPYVNSQIFVYLFLSILLGTFVSLGTWQLNRANEKAALAEQMEALIAKPPIDLNEASEQALPHIKARAHGHFIESDQFLLDNIIHKGKPGYYVLTPFRLIDKGDVILVNRGWLPKSRTLPELPLVPSETAHSQGHSQLNSQLQSMSETTQSTNEMEYRTSEQNLFKSNTVKTYQTIEGVLAEPRSKPVITGNTDSPLSPVATLWYYMDTAFFEQQAGYDVFPLVLRLKPDQHTSLVRDWPTFEAKTGMHIGYAIQWFVFALFVFIAWIGMIYKNKKTSKDDHTHV